MSRYYKQVRVVNTPIGKGTEIVNPVNIYGAEIGENCFIGPFVEIQKGVKIGNNVRIQSHTFICEGVTIADNVFIGHGVMFINDKYPTVNNKMWERGYTHIATEASIGSNATILPVYIGERALIGAGSVVTRSVGAGDTIAGNPAKSL